MKQMESKEKEKVIAKLECFPSSGMPAQLSPKALCKHYKSLHGRDFKLIAQFALQVLWESLPRADQEVWKALSKVVYSMHSILCSILFEYRCFTGPTARRIMWMK